MRVVLALMDLVNTLGVEHMCWSLRGGRVGCSAVTLREILVKSGERGIMLFAVEGFVKKQCKGFLVPWVEEKPL